MPECPIPLLGWDPLSNLNAHHIFSPEKNQHQCPTRSSLCPLSCAIITGRQASTRNPRINSTKNKRNVWADRGQESQDDDPVIVKLHPGTKSPWVWKIPFGETCKRRYKDSDSNLSFFFYFLERGRREGKRKGEKHWSVASGTRPTRIKLATFHFMGWRPTNWATLVSADHHLS